MFKKIKWSLWITFLLLVTSETVAQTNTQQIQKDIIWLTSKQRYHFNRKNDIAEVRQMMIKRFSNAGLLVSKQVFPFAGSTGVNIIGEIKGSKYPDHVIIIAAHYDVETHTPGADDNGAAVAILLDLSEKLSEYHPEITIRLIAFDLEELGLIGSRYYVRHRESTETIRFMVSMEMMGYASQGENTQRLPRGFDKLFPEMYQKVVDDGFRGNFITVIGSGNSSNVLDLCVASYGGNDEGFSMIHLMTPGKGRLTPDLRRSDHAPFWDQNIPAVMLTDTSEFRNDHYHKPSDTWDTLNYPFIYQNARFIHELVKRAGKSSVE